jgi:hypothetical protein
LHSYFRKHLITQDDRELIAGVGPFGEDVNNEEARSHDLRDLSRLTLKVTGAPR